MTRTMAGETRGTREAELAEALTAVRARLTAAAEAAGRNSDEIQLLPVTKFFPATDVSILHHLGCEDFGESREQEAANKAAEVANIVGGAPIRWHMVGRIQRNKARSIAGLGVCRALRRQRAGHRGAEPRRGAGAGRRRTVRAASRLHTDKPRRGHEARRCGCQRPRSGRRPLRRGPGRRGSGVRRADGDSAVGSGPRRSLRTFAIRTCAGTAELSAAPRTVGRDVQRPRGGGRTRLDVCACRYRAIGTTSSNVTRSSHSSHIFITDTRAIMRRVER